MSSIASPYGSELLPLVGGVIGGTVGMDDVVVLSQDERRQPEQLIEERQRLLVDVGAFDVAVEGGDQLRVRAVEVDG